MIFTCGVRFMRAKSAGVRGRLSGSLRAAASISACVMGRMGLAILCEVLIVLVPRGVSRGDQPGAIVSFGMDNGQKHAIRHSDQNKTILAVVLAVIDLLDGERIAKDLPRRFEIDAMLGVIFGGL